MCSLVYLCMYADAELDCEGVLVCSLVNAVGQSCSHVCMFEASQSVMHSFSHAVGYVHVHVSR